MIGKFLIYFSAFFVFYESFPFYNFKLGSAKPLSLPFIIIFLILNINIILKLKFNIREIQLLWILIFLVGLSILSSTINNFGLDNSMSFLNEILVFIIIYIFIKILIQRLNSKEHEKIIKTILNGYIFNNIFGILQYIYIHVYKTDIILSMHKMLLYTTEHIEKGKIQFLFGEPSFISFHILFVIVPILIYFKNNEIKVQFIYKINIFIMIVLSLLSGSFRLYVDIAILLLLYFFMFLCKKKNIIKVFVSIVLVIPSILIILKSDVNPIRFRIEKIINYENESVYIRDHSLWARTTYSKVGFYSIKDNPVIGYGGGNYVFAYKNNLPKVDNDYYYNQELTRNYYYASILPAINMYSRIFCEFGIIGIILFTSIIINLFRCAKKRSIMFILILILFYLIQSSSFVLIPIITLICIIYNYKYLNQIS